jgi:hypothetical protein
MQIGPQLRTKPSLCDGCLAPENWIGPVEVIIDPLECRKRAVELHEAKDYKTLLVYRNPKAYKEIG